MLLVLFLGCSKDESVLGDHYFYSDTIPSEILHDVVFNSNNEMWILGSSLDEEAQVPAWSSFLPYKMELIKKENDKYLVYDRIPPTVMIEFDNADNLMALGNQELRKFKDGEFEAMEGPALSKNANFTSMVIDNYNNIWLSGYNTGIFKYNGDRWLAHNTENSALPVNSAYFLATDGNNVWALLDSVNQIAVITNNEITIHPLPVDEPNYQNYYFLVAFSGNLWLLSQESIYFVDNQIERLTLTRVPGHFTNDGSISIRNAKADKSGNLYIIYSETNSQERKLLKIDENFQMIPIELPPEVKDQTIFTISFDNDNNLWIGSSKGIVKIN